MARFRGTIQGQRGMTSRLGGKSSGLFVTANGWTIGASISLSVNSQDEDVLRITVHGGSGHGISETSVGEFKRADIERLARKASNV